MLQMPNFNYNTPSHILEHRLAMINERKQGTNLNSILVKFKTTKPTFYKFYERYDQFGKSGLYDISKAPKNHGTKTDVQTERKIETLFTQHPYFSSYELNELIPVNPRTIQRIIKRNKLKKVYKHKSEKKKILQKLKSVSQRKIQKK